MRNYETIAIFKVDVGDEYIAELSKKVEKIAKKKPGTFETKEDWGVKKLAYEIDKQKQGHYVSWKYSQESSAPAAVDKALRFEENILRYATYATNEQKARKNAKLEAKKAAKLEARKDKQPEASEETGRRVRPKIDFKNPISLARYLTEKGKIIPRRVSGVNTQTQKVIEREIKRARQIGLLSCVEGLSTGERNRDRDYGDRDSRGGDRDSRSRAPREKRSETPETKEKAE